MKPAEKIQSVIDAHNSKLEKALATATARQETIVLEAAAESAKLQPLRDAVCGIRTKLGALVVRRDDLVALIESGKRKLAQQVSLSLELDELVQRIYVHPEGSIADFFNNIKVHGMLVHAPFLVTRYTALIADSMEKLAEVESEIVTLSENVPPAE